MRRKLLITLRWDPTELSCNERNYLNGIAEIQPDIWLISIQKMWTEIVNFVNRFSAELVFFKETGTSS